MIDKKTGTATNIFNGIAVVLGLSFFVLIGITGWKIVYLIYKIVKNNITEEIIRSDLIIIFFCFLGMFFTCTLACYDDFLNSDEASYMEFTILSFRTFNQLYKRSNSKRWFFMDSNILFYPGNLEHIKDFFAQNFTVGHLIEFARDEDKKVVKIDMSYFNWLIFLVWKMLHREKIYSRNGLDTIINTVESDMVEQKIKEKVGKKEWKE